ncbi:MAG: serine hydrolase [Desulfobacterales bacterium]|nr:serine hydrolase [Desulfobacterales bacterium]
MKKTMSNLTFWGLLGLLFFFNGGLSANDRQKEQSFENEISGLIQPFIENDLFQGRVLVAKNGKVIFNKGYGFANMEWEIPSNPETKYRIASISKQFTDLIILQLVSEGNIKLEGKIRDYLPSYRKETGEKVTIHQLMSHTSGLPNGGHIVNGFWSRSEHTRINYSKKDFIEKFCSGDLEFEPGTQFRYTSVGYIILGAIIEEICGKPYPEVFAERIAKKIGLHNTECDDNLSLVANRASGYARDSFGWKNSDYHYMPILDGAGTVLTTTEDLYKYDQALYTEKLLAREYLDLFFKPIVAYSEPPFFSSGGYYSYGWIISNLSDAKSRDGIKIISHGGSIRGGSGFFGRQVDKNISVIILSNTEIGSPALREIGMDILRILNGLEPLNSYKIPVRLVIGKEIVGNGFNAAVEKYEDLKRNDFQLFDFRENQLNSLGYSLINKGMIDEAIAMLKRNVEAYPESANVYDSLAEAFMLSGRNDLAIKNYEKSLRLNPENANARLMLEKLKK